MPTKSRARQEFAQRIAALPPLLHPLDADMSGPSVVLRCC